MEWFEELVSKLLSSLPGPKSENRSLDRLAALGVIAESKRFKQEDLKEVKKAFRTELDEFIAAGSRPSVGRKPTGEILYHHRRIDGLAQLVELPLEADSRSRVAKAIRDEGDALHESYYAYCERILARWGRCIDRM